MRLPRFRFTIRRMMIAVAVLSAVLGLLAERRTRFSGLAAHHRSQWSKPWPIYIGVSHAPPCLTEQRRARHLRLAEKYKHAARYPWLPVAPDPPDPK